MLQFLLLPLLIKVLLKFCFDKSVVSQRRNKRPVLIKRPVSNKRYLEVPKVNKPPGR